MARVHAPPAPEPGAAGLAQWLGVATGLRVEGDACRWEPSAGVVTDLIGGRPLLCVARRAGDRLTDLYRVRVQLTPAGRPFRLRRLRNLSGSPLAAETGLVLRGARAAYVTQSAGRITAVTLLDLGGPGGSARPAGRWQGFIFDLMQLERDGDPVGLERTRLLPPHESGFVELSLSEDQLGVRFGGESQMARWAIRRRAWVRGDGESTTGIQVVPTGYAPQPWAAWLADRLRWQLGSGPVAAGEHWLLEARDWAQRAWHRVAVSSGTRAAAPGRPQGSRHAMGGPPPLSAPELLRRPNDGRWVAVSRPFFPPAPGGGSPRPPFLYQTVLHPDPERPFASWVLVAMDMHQLELGVVAGYRDPRPSTGSPGEGRIPREGGEFERTVAAFNGAFKAEHGSYGMTERGRVLLPARPGAATVAVDRQRRTHLGAWPPPSSPGGGWFGLRQNLRPLVVAGRPSGDASADWGWKLDGRAVATQRSALCATRDGQLVYAFAEQATGERLARVLATVGCSFAVHLDMNPGHCAFSFLGSSPSAAGELQGELAHPAMAGSPTRYARWSADDFFYLALKPEVPRGLAGQDWRPSPGAQPEPRWRSALWHRDRDVGGLRISLTSFEAGRLTWVVRAGRGEPVLPGAPPLRLDLGQEQRSRVLASLGLGHATRGSRLGLAFHGVASLPFRSERASLVVKDGALRLEAGASALDSLPQETVQLPWLARDGVLEERARDHGAMRTRGALCIAPAGRIYVAMAEHDSSGPLAATLLDAGCRDVVELDRGSHHPAFIHRRGTDLAPQGTYEPSVLLALESEAEAPVRIWSPAR